MMAMRCPLHYLFQNAFGFVLADSSRLLDLCQQIPWRSVFHHNKKVLTILKDLQQADDIHMHQLLQDQNFLQDLHPGEIIFHVNFVDALDGHQFVGEDLLSQMDFAEASFSE